LIAEFNIWEDPEAARSVFASGANIIAVGLDVANNPAACLSPEHLEQLRAGQTCSAKLATRVAGYVIARNGRCDLHDPLALTMLLDASLFEVVSVPVDIVIEDGLERGRTRILVPERARGVPLTRVAINVDGPRFLELFISRLLEA